ncbi:MerR family transcriptional regulator [Acetivibrio ethanolgignens]|uniref:HTH merR-type domain-containing protein n=1 Tax=Acetivibrio ethanolgignens TaxID=290052 RepID=A0A0V8QCX8_9FIRM|nr:MerR family transcriptional regulator [Acetivibrio ethanolgignens]KSV58445.1 hypothetical protein ASU35_12885 [Acetivibrio ethanolgignens]
MNEVRYMISDAAKLLDVEAHALRYWEEELDLKIPRNEMGHRYYREKEIKMLEKIKDLKDKGYQLRAIKMEIEEMETKGEKVRPLALVKKEGKELEADHGIGDLSPAEKMQQFREIMGEIIEQAIRNNNDELCQNVGEVVSSQVLKEMDYLARDKDEKDEERFRRLDEVIREIQKSRQEAAAADMVKLKEKKKKGFFRR